MSKLKDQRRASSTVSNLQFSKSITQLSKIKNAVILIQNTPDDDYQMRTESHKPEKYLQLLSFPLFSGRPEVFVSPSLSTVLGQFAGTSSSRYSSIILSFVFVRKKATTGGTIFKVMDARLSIGLVLVRSLKVTRRRGDLIVGLSQNRKM
jgi:hypothetical protein